MKKVIRIKEERLGGNILALFDLDQKTYDNGEFLVLPSVKPAVIARQLMAVLGEFGRNPLVVGVTEDLKALCVRYGVVLNPKWRVFPLSRRGQ